MAIRDKVVVTTKGKKTLEVEVTRNGGYLDTKDEGDFYRISEMSRKGDRVITWTLFAKDDISTVEFKHG